MQNRAQAGRIFRAVLHALRDRIPAEKAAHLGAQLPIIWKGIYFDGYKVRREPIVVRHAQDWLVFVASYDAFAEGHDFPTAEHTRRAFMGVMNALEELLSPGQYSQVVDALHTDIQELLYVH
ncbi:hypothetical protein ASU33_04370 [Solirubrum puertoriconensis]|uniref:DUF2267 domain-containing protein n=1 Tax=Solirubrum puertoriconensis TaxID=1751427 RepID=A0A9X0L419_SOLP1|nr:hypothetical protein ASU33_04370 [Solirubrum puertoriconensis]